VEAREAAAQEMAEVARDVYDMIDELAVEFVWRTLPAGQRAKRLGEMAEFTRWLRSEIQ